MTRLAHDRLLKACVCLVPTVCLLLLVAKTRQWPVISDATLMHYVVALMRHGEAPYRQIVDINMPGAYAVEWVATQLFGDTATGWRLFDFSLMAIAGSAMVSIGDKSERYAGLFAGLLFALVHVSDGVAEAGQRDFCMAVLLLVACAFAFRAVRSGRPHWMALSGLAAGAAVTIKPTALLFAGFLLGIGAAVRIRQRGVWAGWIVAGTLGLLLPPALAGVWLWRAGALSDFWRIVRGLLPYHAAMARHTPGFLLRHAVPGPLLLLAVTGGVLFAANKEWRNWERMTLLAGVLSGFISYFAQGKAYPYHRYPMLAFLLLLAALEFAEAMRGRRLLRLLAISGFAYGTLWLAPASTAKALRYDWHDQRSLTALQQDLTQLGGPALSGHVQCMDTMAGCITVLDRMRLVQSTGFLYDCYLFSPEASSVQQQMRADFLEAISKNPPKIFIVTDQLCFNYPPGYQKLKMWPEFASYLQDHYAITEQRVIAPEPKMRLAAGPFGYRIYIQRSY